jgi:hypothetical protein
MITSASTRVPAVQAGSGQQLGRGVGGLLQAAAVQVEHHRISAQGFQPEVDSVLLGELDARLDVAFRHVEAT